MVMKTTRTITNKLIVTLCFYNLVVAVPIIGLAKTQSPETRRIKTQALDTKQPTQQFDKINPTKIPQQTQLQKNTTENTVKSTAPNQTLRERMYNALRSAFFGW
jgi:hypothetical protein